MEWILLVLAVLAWQALISWHGNKIDIESESGTIVYRDIRVEFYKNSTMIVSFPDKTPHNENLDILINSMNDCVVYMLRRTDLASP